MSLSSSITIDQRFMMLPVMLRCTAKLLTLLGVSSRELADVEPRDTDWYANLLWIDRRKCVLFAHADTLFTILAADVRKADLAPLAPFVVGAIKAELRSERLPTDTFGDLDASGVQIARTASRTVLGYMNEVARSCEYWIAEAGGLRWCDIAQINRDLRRELHLSRQPPGHFVPIDLVRSRSRP